MRYILNDNGYIQAVSFNNLLECQNKTCTEYTGTVPTGYENLAIWSETANINAYKIVNGNLVFDSEEDARLQSLWASQETTTGITGDTLPIGSEVDYNGDTVPAGWEEVADPDVYSTEEKVIGTWVNGYKIYRKVIQTTSSIKNGDNVIPVNIPNLGMVVNSRMYNNNANYTFPYHSSVGYTFLQNVTSTSITIRSTDTWSSCLWTFVLEYTKTTG